MKISFFYKRKDGSIISNEPTNSDVIKNEKTIKKIAQDIEKKCEEYKDEIDFNKDSEDLDKLLKAFKEELKNKDNNDNEDNKKND